MLGHAGDGTVRQWVETAEAFPDPRSRIAPWTTHRDLRHHADRHSIITPGMTSRQARAATGKAPLERKAMSRLTVESLADDVIDCLLWPGVKEAVAQRQAMSQEERRASRLAAQAATEADKAKQERRKATRKLWDSDDPYRLVADLQTKFSDFEDNLRLITLLVLEFGHQAVPQEYWDEFVALLQRIDDEAYDTILAIKGEQPSRPRVDFEVPQAGPRQPGSRPRELPAPNDASV
jgi:hypothetical protein